MKRITAALATFLVTAGLTATFLMPTPAAGALDCGVDNPPPACKARGGVGQAGGSSSPNLASFIQKVINILLFIIGIIAVIMIVIAGIQYVTSGGNADQASRAKNTIIYAVVGIIVAVMAYAIVGFVIGNI